MSEQTENLLQTRADADRMLRETQERIEKEIAAKEQAEKEKSEKVEPKVEEKAPEVKAEETPVVPEVEDKKTWQDLLAEEHEQKLAEEKRKQFESLYEDELAKTILEAKRQGKDVRQVLKALAETDPSDFTEKDLFTMTLSGEKNEDGEPLSEYEIDEKYEQFQAMPKSIQNRIIETQKAELENKFKEATKVFSVTPQSEYADAAKKATEELISVIDNMAGKTLYGFDITKNIAKELYKEASEQLKTTFNGGNFNVELAVEKAISVKMLPHLLNHTAKKAETDAKIELFKQFNTPSATGKPVITSPVVKSKAEEQAEKLQAHANRYANPFGLPTNN
jgi:hypothetical protein